MNIRTKLAIVFLSIALAPLFLLSVLSFQNARNSLVQATLKNLNDIADSKEGEILAFLREKRARAVDFASGTFIRQETENILREKDAAAKEKISVGLSRYLRIDKQLLDADIVEISIADPQGSVIASTHQDDLGKKLKLSNLTGSHKIAHFYDAEIMHDKPVVNVAASIAGLGKKEIVAALLISFDLNCIQEIVSGDRTIQSGAKTALGMSGTRGIYLANKEGYLILSYNKMEELGYLSRKVETEPVLAGIKSKEEVNKETLDYNGRRVFSASMYLAVEEDVPWILVVEQDIAEALLPADKLKKLIIIITAIVFLLAAAAAGVTALSISRPIQDLHKGTEIIGAGNLDYKVATEEKDEIGQLSRAFDKMVENLKRITASRDELNKEIAERKKAQNEAQAKTDELERFNRFFIGRENKMAELKKENEELKNKLGGRGKESGRLC